MENYNNFGISPNGSRRSKGTSNDHSLHFSQLDINDFNYKVQQQNASSSSRQPTDHTLEYASADKISGYSDNISLRNIKLLPVKVKDVKEIMKSAPLYNGKLPIMIGIKENEIGKVIKQQHDDNLKRLSDSQRPLEQSPNISVIQTEESRFLKQEESPVFFERMPNNEIRQSFKLSPERLVQPRTQQVYAMSNVPVGSKAFRAQRNPKKRTPRVSSTRKLFARRPRPRSRERSRSKTRVRSMTLRPRTHSKKHRSRSKSPVIVVKRRRYPIRDNCCCCPTFPMCDDACTGTFRHNRYVTSRRTARSPVCTYEGPIRSRSHSPYRPITRSPKYAMNRPRITQSRISITCDCNLCMGKLDLIQPGVCTERKDMWTNEYAIIPKKQINLIDPCDQLDPKIYPRADNPCIRDGYGSPLTDCIGRPLRDPIGKKFLKFSANGSVLETNVRGNFYSGQPPLCVKCPLPTNYCAPDTTHNWWTNCGYPIQADMSPYY